MITPLINPLAQVDYKNSLTNKCFNINLCLHLEKSANGIGVPKTNGISRTLAVFLCVKSQIYIFMSNWVEQPKGWLESFVPVRQFYLFRHHNWRYVVGFSTLQTEAIMPRNHATKPISKAQTKTVSLISIFSLFDSDRKLITSSLTFQQVKPISEHINGSVIKYQAMISAEILI